MKDYKRTFSVRTQFHKARCLTRRAFAATMASSTTTHEPDISKSSAQVETLVLPQAVIPKAGELKLRKKRPSPLTLRASEQHKTIIRAKAQKAGVTVNHFVLASALGSDYRPPHDRAFVLAMLALYRELAAQGNNLNQLARQRNANQISAEQADSMLDILGRSLLQTHRAVRHALTQGQPEP